MLCVELTERMCCTEHLVRRAQNKKQQDDMTSVEWYVFVGVLELDIKTQNTQIIGTIFLQTIT